MIEIKLLKTNNGATITSNDETICYKFDDDDKEDIKIMFYDIMELLGYYNSKHNKYNVYVEVKKT